MTNINWDLAPEGTVAVGQRFGELAFINYAGLAYIGDDWVDSSGWNIIGKRPQPEHKTVEAAKSEPEWKELSVYGKPKSTSDKPEWTHYGDGGDICKLLSDKADSSGFVPTQKEDGSYWIQYLHDLKPIKPPITRLEAEVIFDFADSIGQLQVAEQWVDNNYTITD